MNNITQLSKNKCVSCRSCEQICPKNAVYFKESIEGFLYPCVNDNCISCGSCIKRCPILSPVENSKFEKVSYVAYLKDNELLKKSTSGGVFAGLAQKCIVDGGYVYGAAYDENLFVEQMVATNLSELEKLKGSKYVASDTKDSFSEVKQLLKNNKKIVYSGTPCQIGGLNAYLGKDFDNLLTIDLICHGVPSQKLFNKYLEWQCKKNKGKIIYCGFRDKDVGGWSCGGKIKTKTKTKTKTIDGNFDPYYRSFLNCKNYRESCYSCPFVSLGKRPGDITIGDFFEVSHFYPNIDRTQGVSLVIINSKKGFEYFESVKNDFNLFPIESSQYLPVKGNLINPSPRPKERNNYYDEIDDLSAKDFWNRFAEVHISYKIRYYSFRFTLKLIPKRVKKAIKYFLRKV